MVFCSKCGTKLVEGANFCHNCGMKVVNKHSKENLQQSELLEVQILSQQQNLSVREQEYVGKILKCSNCGAHITETTAVCPECGMQITKRAAVSSIQTFKEELMKIESVRKGGLGGAFGIYSHANESDIQKLSLIRNFPIPNSIDDCSEFMLLAIANIDVGLSKKTAYNKLMSNGQIESAATIGRTISNAWVSKMEQVYRKAEMSFPNEPEFVIIQKMYFDKMKELKIKV